MDSKAITEYRALADMTYLREMTVEGFFGGFFRVLGYALKR
jgi:hypothetical protein